MTITYCAIDDLKSAICTQWDACACVCAGAKPTIDIVWDKKLVGFDSDNTERIIIQPLKEDIKIFDIYGRAWWHDLPVKIDIRTYCGDTTRQRVVVKEVIRIIKNIIRRNAQGFLQVVIKDSETRNQDFRNMYRHIVTLMYQSVDTVDFI